MRSGDGRVQSAQDYVLLIATGSVASTKVPLIASELKSYNRVSIEIIATKHAQAFFDSNKIREDGIRIWEDSDEWHSNYKIGDPILHIELRRWADVVLIAPCSANTLAKMANGLTDNLATSVLRALAPTTPTFVFPAMNTLMFEHPLTEHHLRTVREILHYNVVGPISKALACGDIGQGAMTEWKEIVEIVVTRFQLTRNAV